MTKGWLAKQLKMASDEVKDWPEWKKEELQKEASYGRSTKGDRRETQRQAQSDGAENRY